MALLQGNATLFKYFIDMKHIIATVLFAGLSFSNLYSQYYFSNNNDGTETITITEYTESDELLVVPKIYEGKTVTRIKKLLGSNNTTTQQIFLPDHITITGSLTTNRTELRCAVIEEETIQTENGAFSINNDNARNNSKLDCIYVFGHKKPSRTELVSVSSEPYLCYYGYAEISYLNKTDKEEVQVYTWGYNNDPKMSTYGEERYKYLVWALEQHLANKGRSINEIVDINFSGLNNTPVNNKNLYIIYNFGNFNPASLLNYGATVIAGDTTYTHLPEGMLEVTDKVDYVGPVADIRTELSYSRTNTKGWNTVCLPFAINETDFTADSNTKIYTISSGDHDNLNLAQVDGVEAGEPCFIYTDAENWDLNLTNCTIPAGITPKETTVDNTWKMIGSFTNQTIGVDHFKLNGDGTMLGRTNSDAAVTYPFRCYLDYIGTASAAPERVRVGIDEEETITIIPDNGEPQQVRLYDLMGRPAKEDGEVRLRHDNIIIR